jgi:hypothetical protein
MNKIPEPTYDDIQALTDLSVNPKAGSFPDLQADVGPITQGYLQYIAAKGDAFAINPVALTGLNAEYLRAHYKSPPRNLSYITALREDTEHRTCPMCGSLHRGTLDHLLPKNTYGEFSVFSKNLVPACKCNSKRKETLKGLLPNQRILHPYFDKCLAGRLVSAKFEALGAVPRVGLTLVVPTTHPQYAAIDFHFQSIVMRTAVKGYLSEKWSDLVRKPSLVVRDLKRNPATVSELTALLKKERLLLDESHKSKNNWNSVFISGLLEQSVRNWLFVALNAPGRQPDKSLI